MKLAVENSEVKLEDIDYINAHATSTPAGDIAEINAIKKLFKNENDFKKTIYISSLKGSLGHLLGSAGAVETIFTVLACKNKIIPPTINLTEIDPEIKLDSFLKLNQEELYLNSNKIIALKNSFGFGGTNASLILSSFWNKCFELKKFLFF